MAADDRDLLHAIFTMPGVRRHIFDDEILPPERTVEIGERSVGLFRDRGLGLWIARPRTMSFDADRTSSGSHAAGLPAVGFGGFWFFRDPPELELLYGVVDDQVGRGYGREIARALVSYGFETLQMPAIRASCDAAHAASRRLLDALGFHLEREANVDGLETAFYEIRKKGPDPFSVFATRP